MAWNPNVPQSTDALSQSQVDILGNFQALDALFNDGVQNYVILPVQSTDPTTSSTEIALYSKVGITGSQDLFIRQVSSGAVIDMTASNQATTGWTYLPSGLILRWGAVGVTSTTQTYTLPTGGGIPAFNNIFQIFVTPRDTSSNTNFTIGLRSITGTTAFTVYSQNPTSATAMIYFIIGN